MATRAQNAVRAAPLARLKEGAAYAGTLLLEELDSTVLVALVDAAHAANPASNAYCIRHHPHDVMVEIYIPAEELHAAMTAVVGLADTYTVTALDADRCRVLCDSFRSHANPLRRTLMGRLPALVCDEVSINVNTSDTINEQAAFMIGQVKFCCGDLGKGCSASIDVQGRPVLAADIRFLGGTSVAAKDADVVLVFLKPAQCFQASLHCVWGQPFQHSKFHSVAAVSYFPEVKLAKLPSSAIEKALAPYSISAELIVTRRDGGPVRLEVLAEIAPEVLAFFTGRVELEVESLGGADALASVAAAISFLRAEAVRVASVIEEVRGAGRADSASV
jgi:hypothetical protein